MKTAWNGPKPNITPYTDLLGDPIDPSQEDNLPSNVFLDDIEGLRDHRIVGAFSEQDCLKGHAVFVTATGCVLVIEAEGGNFDEDPSIEVQRRYGDVQPDLTKLVRYQALHNVGLISKAKHDELEAAANEEARKRAAARAQRLERELAEIRALAGGGAPNEQQNKDPQ